MSVAISSWSAGDLCWANRIPLPRSVPELLTRLATRSIHPYDELQAQVEKILDAGITPFHLDTHKHTHLAFPVLSAVARLSEEFRIPWVRRPFDFPLSGTGPIPLEQAGDQPEPAVLRNRFHSELSKSRMPDHRSLCGLSVDRLSGELKN